MLASVTKGAMSTREGLSLCVFVLLWVSTYSVSSEDRTAMAVRKCPCTRRHASFKCEGGCSIVPCLSLGCQVLALRGAGDVDDDSHAVREDMEKLSIRSQETQAGESDQSHLSAQEAEVEKKRAKFDRLVAELREALEELPSEDDEEEAVDDAILEAATLFPAHMPSVYNKGRALHDIRDYDGARAAYEAALRCENKPEWKECRAHALSNLGLLHHMCFNNRTAAEICYRAAMDVDEGHVHALNNCAVLLERVQKASTRETVHIDVESADKMYNRALVTDSNHVPTLVNFGYFKEKQLQEYEEAEALYNKALVLDPNNTFALRNYAGFLCNVREPYDEDTLMPVHFNKTCHKEGAYDPRTTLPINPEVVRPVDLARAMYNKVLEIRNPCLLRRDDEDELGPELLMHGAFCPSRAPMLSLAVDPGSARSSVSALREQLAKAEAVLHGAEGEDAPA